MLPKNQKDDLKLIYKIKTSKGTENKRISTETLKMDENKQYGNLITKPLPCGCIKEQQKIPSHREFNVILKTLSYTDKIEHLFLLAIKFRVENEKAMLYNEIYTPIFEKSKLIKTIPKISRSTFEYFVTEQRKRYYKYI